MRYYTYIHYKLDGTPFYVGKGCGNRAYKKHGRNSYWKRIVDKYNYYVEILDYFQTETEAHNREKSLISTLKQSGFKLCNLTEGGEGTSGRLTSDKTKLKIGAKSKGRAHNKGFNNPSNKLSAEDIINIDLLIVSGVTSVSIANKYNISDSTVAKIKYRKKQLYRDILPERIYNEI
jgi:hypothetical protein